MSARELGTRHKFIACSTQHRGKNLKNTVDSVEAPATLMLHFLLESKFQVHGASLCASRWISVGISVDLRASVVVRRALRRPSCIIKIEYFQFLLKNN